MEKRIEVSNEIMITLIENEWHENQYCVNVLRPSTLESTRIGQGRGSGKQGILTPESGKKIFNKLKQEYDFSEYEFTSSDEERLFNFVEEHIKTI